MPLEIEDITSENGLIPAINTRFDSVQEIINNFLLWRQGNFDELVMYTLLDMAENPIINLPEPTAPTHPVRLQDLEAAQMPGAYDHGLLLGLEDDDHPQYLTEARADAIYLRDDNGPLTEGGILFADLNGDVAEHADTFFRHPVDGTVSIGHNNPQVPLDVHRRVDQGPGEVLRVSAPAAINDEYVSISLADPAQDVLDTEIRSVRKSTNTSTVEIHNKILGVKTKVASVTELGGFLVHGAIATGDEASPDVDQGGACFNQGVGTGKIATFKSSTVTQPFTSLAEADTFAYFQKNGATGGVNLTGLSSANTGFFFRGLATTPLTGFNQNGVMTFDAAKSDGGTGRSAIAATENVFSLTNNNTRMLQIKGSGSQILLGGLSTGAEEAPDTDLAGICINHGSSDGNAFTIKNSDVAHPFTSVAEADTYFRILKESATLGGARLGGFSETTGAALVLVGNTPTPNSTLATDPVTKLVAMKNTGTTVTSLAATENAVGIFNNTSQLALFKGNGNQVNLGGLSTGGEEAPDVDLGGICINHGSGNFRGLSVKNSSVNHPFSTVAEADTYFSVRKADNTNGGGNFDGFSGSNAIAVHVRGFQQTASSSFTDNGAVVITGFKSNGTTGVSAHSSTENTVSIQNASTKLAQFKGNGNLELLGGIKLSNTGTVLANYEEGTWTPVIADAASAGNVATFTNNGAVYTRIGREVRIRLFAASINTTGMTAGNNVFIRGLPYTVATGALSIGDCRSSNVTYTGELGLMATAASTNMNIFNTVSGGAAANINVSALTSGTAQLILDITYHI